jgi:hypothetical protein
VCTGAGADTVAGHWSRVASAVERVAAAIALVGLAAVVQYSRRDL